MLSERVEATCVLLGLSSQQTQRTVVCGSRRGSTCSLSYRRSKLMLVVAVTPRKKGLPESSRNPTGWRRIVFPLVHISSERVDAQSAACQKFRELEYCVFVSNSCMFSSCTENLLRIFFLEKEVTTARFGTLSTINQHLIIDAKCEKGQTSSTD